MSNLCEVCPISRVEPTQAGVESNASDSTDDPMARSIMTCNAVIVKCSSSPEVCDVHSRSLEAGRSRVGIAEWDDTG